MFIRNTLKCSLKQVQAVSSFVFFFLIMLKSKKVKRQDLTPFASDFFVVLQSHCELNLSLRTSTAHQHFAIWKNSENSAPTYSVMLFLGKLK